MIEKYKLYAGTLFAALWISLCWGFVQEEFIGLLERVRPFVFLLLDLIFIILGVFALRNRRDAIFVGLFVIIVSASALLNSQSLLTVFNGSRDFIGLVLALLLYTSYAADD